MSYPFVFCSGSLPSYLVLPPYFLDIVKRFNGQIFLVGDDLRFVFTHAGTVVTLDLPPVDRSVTFPTLLAAVTNYLVTINWLDVDPSPPLPGDVAITNVDCHADHTATVTYQPPPDYVAPPPVCSLIGYVIFLGITPVYLVHSPMPPNPSFEYVVERSFVFRDTPVPKIPVSGTITCTRPGHFVVISNRTIYGRTVVTITKPAYDPRPIEEWTDSVISNFHNFDHNLSKVAPLP